MIQIDHQEASIATGILKCSIKGCQKMYKRTDGLDNHLRSEHGIDIQKKKARFTCSVSSCGKSFFHASNLSMHLTTEHKIPIGKFLLTLRTCACISLIQILLQRLKVMYLPAKKSFWFGRQMKRR